MSHVFCHPLSAHIEVYFYLLECFLLRSDLHLFLIALQLVQKHLIISC